MTPRSPSAYNLRRNIRRRRPSNGLRSLRRKSEGGGVLLSTGSTSMRDGFLYSSSGTTPSMHSSAAGSTGAANASERDRATADILLAFFHVARSDSGSPIPKSESGSNVLNPAMPWEDVAVGFDNTPPREIILPCMKQTDFILQTWRSEDEGGLSSDSSDIEDMDMDNERPAMWPQGMAASMRRCGRGSMSSESSFDSALSGPLTPRSPASQHSALSTKGLPSPAYTEWNNSNCSPSEASSSSSYLSRYSSSSSCSSLSSSFSSVAGFQENYFSARDGILSPPQSPSDSCFGGATKASVASHLSQFGSASMTLLPPNPSMHHPVSPSGTSSGQDEKKTVQTKTSSTSTSTSTSTSHHVSPPTKRQRMPKPHCNVKYETAELDFIMYQRCTKNRAWDDVTAAFNAALPRLRQYAEMDFLSLGGGDATAAAMERYRPRPERTTPGLQASYYRQRLALPLLDEEGQLSFDEKTNKQIFTEVMVRDDKSRKRRGPYSMQSKKPTDARVHLVLYFPERVAYYNYWFVTAEDKELARERAADRNMQRARRGLPPWEPGSDDPETGILIRNKD